MRNFNFKALYRAIFILGIGLFLANCDGEDGANGLDGVDGINGENGENGENGLAGEDGEGFDELTQYGSITLNLSGTRADNVPFTHEAELKFSPNDIDDNKFSTRSEILLEYRFDIQRFLNIPNSYNDNSVDLEFTVINPESETPRFELNLGLRDYTIVSDEDLKFFELYENFFSISSVGNPGIDNFNVTDYTFDEATNELSFSFSMDVNGDYNQTGNDLSISGTVDVIVFERVISVER
ncbi:hypothetical protein [Aquimarina algicola]|uniref:Collagen-like protein n=1 Tax=Aquimarina algicola TaxID=2589995 RepID=A0A504JHL5_9FLAO|nr:hypothetical protein [Aquimarina algicola]TPN85960.1 hypothetical protein FHK87_11810 [Aquimarina algicola]